MNANAAGESARRVHELYDLGLAYIRSAIRANLAEVDNEIAAAGILHPAWSRSLPPPETVQISVMPAYAPVVTVEFTGREIQDSWRGVVCADASRKVRFFALEYQRVRAEVSSYPRRRETSRAPNRIVGMTAGKVSPVGEGRSGT